VLTTAWDDQILLLVLGVGVLTLWWYLVCVVPNRISKRDTLKRKLRKALRETRAATATDESEVR
jgi:hypothetical protein